MWRSGGSSSRLSQLGMRNSPMFTGAANASRQPAISLPLQWTSDGLPIGIPLMGRPADEATLLRVSAQLEEAKPWAHRRPPAVKKISTAVRRWGEVFLQPDQPNH